MAATNYRSTVVPLGAHTSDATRYIFRAPERCIINSIYVIEGTTRAASDSNYATYTVTNIEDDATGTDVVATLSNNVAGGAVTADVPKAMVLSTTAANLEIAEGDILQLTINIDVAGTSRPDAEFAAIVNWTPGTGPGQ